MTEPNLEGMSLQEAMTRLENAGFAGAFRSDAEGAVECLHCSALRDVSEFVMLAQERVEGASDPADEVLVAGVECPSCGTRGTLLLPYGSQTRRADAQVMRELHAPF